MNYDTIFLSLLSTKDMLYISVVSLSIWSVYLIVCYFMMDLKFTSSLVASTITGLVFSGLFLWGISDKNLNDFQKSIELIQGMSDQAGSLELAFDPDLKKLQNDIQEKRKDSKHYPVHIGLFALEHQRAKTLLGQPKQYLSKDQYFTLVSFSSECLSKSDVQGDITGALNTYPVKKDKLKLLISLVSDKRKHSKLSLSCNLAYSKLSLDNNT